jgi:hypothetical protein
MRKPNLKPIYKPKRIFLETLIGYQEASRVRAIDQWS